MICLNFRSGHFRIQKLIDSPYIFMRMDVKEVIRGDIRAYMTNTHRITASEAHVDLARPDLKRKTF